jgi:hypothetical protein
MVIVFGSARAARGRPIATVAPAAASLRNLRRDVAVELAGFAMVLSLV